MGVEAPCIIDYRCLTMLIQPAIGSDRPEQMQAELEPFIAHPTRSCRIGGDGQDAI